MASLCFDYGHGGADPGGVYKGRKEADDALRLGMDVAKIVRQHGVAVDETRTTDKTVSLQQRSDFERKGSYDYFISFHRNAYKPEVALGVETYTYLNAGTKAKGMATKIQEALVGLGFVNRGVKEKNLHVVRETKAPAVLIEVGFIDNTGDNRLFDAKYPEMVEGLAKAILGQLGIAYRGETVKVDDPDVYLLVKARVSKAPGLLDQVKAMGFACKPVDPDPDVQITIRVRTSKADGLAKQVREMGFACKRLDLA